MFELPWKKLQIPNSNANYWLLDRDSINNMQWVVTPLNPSLPVFKEPHAVVEGTVSEVITESDSDIHVWLTLDNTTKDRLACEITPQNKLQAPNIGDHVRIYGIFRYDLQHGWPEIHPVDYIENIT